MNNVFVGDVIRQCRMGKGITQEELCKGICSVSTLSRIENGLQHPTRSVFILLTERMGEEGLVYDDYLGDYDYEVYELVVKIIICLDRGDIQGSDNYLTKLRYIVGDGRCIDDKGECIYKFVELLSASVDCNIRSSASHKTEVYQYGYYLYEEVSALLDKCMSLNEKRDKEELDRIEIRMYNLMGYAKFLQDDYRSAIDIWVNLIEGYRNKDSEGLFYSKEIASLYCNVSAALSALEMYDEAYAFASIGLRMCFDKGGLRLVNRLLHNRMYCLKLKGDNNKAYIDLAFSKAICTAVKKDILKGEKIKNLPNTPFLIQIF